MKTTLTALIVATALIGISSAASIVQTQTFSSVPDFNVDLTFDQFDTMGGTRILTSITVGVTYAKIGGRLEVDNDSATAGTIDLTHRVRGSLSSADVSLSKTFGTIGSLGSLDAVSTLTGQSIGATSGDSTASFNNTGNSDYFLFEPVDTSAGNSGDVRSSDWSAGPSGGYVGSGTYVINFDATQTNSVTGVGGLAQAFVPSSVDGVLTVTYNYDVIPEPSVALLGAIGVLGLLRRRR